MGVNIPFIMLTGHGNISTAVEAMKAGAYDFISKPPDLNRLLTAVRNALETKNLVAENIKLKKRIAKKYKIIGESEAIDQIHIMIDKVAPTDARVLITGKKWYRKRTGSSSLTSKEQTFRCLIC